MSLNFKKSTITFLILCLSGLFMILPANAQTGETIDISGIIKDVQGEPIIGANILIEGTGTGTISDFDGNFSLRAPANGILNVSYIGYVTIR